MRARRKLVETRQALNRIVDMLNDKVALPFDINVSVRDCDDPDDFDEIAFYDAGKCEVTICYQITDEFQYLLSHKIKSKARLARAVRGVLIAAFLHELGHALVDAWNLPITGREEDAADQFSTLMLLDWTEDGEQMALDVSLAFKIYGDMDRYEEKIYWDEHSFDKQRYYDTICMIYGHDPKKYDYLVREGTLPIERADLCSVDYTRIQRSWQTLLSPYLKEESVIVGVATVSK